MCGGGRLEVMAAEIAEVPIPPVVEWVEGFPAVRSVGPQFCEWQLQVSDSCIGRVIGRGGSSLNQIRLLTGASIDVSGSSAPGAVRPVSISGTAAQVQARTEHTTSTTHQKSSTQRACRQ